jgi:hypothetical protein
MKCYVVTCEIIQGLFVYSAGVNRGRIIPSVLSSTGATSDDIGWTEGSIGAENIARSINEGDPDVRGFVAQRQNTSARNTPSNVHEEPAQSSDEMCFGFTKIEPPGSFH